VPERKIFATPQDAETAFYEALERADLDAMMAIWAEDEDVVCTHPGGERLVGFTAVRDAWRAGLRRQKAASVRLSQRQT
jgi:ketosteroid isomerase-like protein